MSLINVDELMRDKVWLCGGFVGDDYAQGYMDALDKVEDVIRKQTIVKAIPFDSEYIKQIRWERDIAISQLEDIGCSFGQDMTEVKEKLNTSNNELFEKRILFESLSQIMENQRDIMRHLNITKYDSDWGYDDNYTRELITQCNGIVNEIKWREKG